MGTLEPEETDSPAELLVLHALNAGQDYRERLRCLLQDSTATIIAEAIQGLDGVLKEGDPTHTTIKDELVRLRAVFEEEMYEAERLEVFHAMAPYRQRANAAVLGEMEERDSVPTTVDVTLQYQPRLTEASREARHGRLESEFTQIAPLVAFYGGALDFKTISPSAQTIEALLPTEDLYVVEQMLAQKEIRMDVIVEHQCTSEVPDAPHKIVPGPRHIPEGPGNLRQREQWFQKGTSFAEFMAEVEAEAQEDGPEAVAELEALRAHYREKVEELREKLEPPTLREAAERLKDHQGVFASVPAVVETEGYPDISGSPEALATNPHHAHCHLLVPEKYPCTCGVTPAAHGDQLTEQIASAWMEFKARVEELCGQTTLDIQREAAKIYRGYEQQYDLCQDEHRMWAEMVEGKMASDWHLNRAREMGQESYCVIHAGECPPGSHEEDEEI